MSATGQIEVRRLAGAELAAHLGGLADVLADCVAGGASVSYMAPFSHQQAPSVFEASPPRPGEGLRAILAAFADDRVVGTVQVVLAVPPNQPHRGRSQGCSCTAPRAGAALPSC